MGSGLKIQDCEYFQYALYVANSTAQYPTVTVISQYGAGQTESGKVYVPPATESYQYDSDGNLIRDGRWTNRWDGENRLVEVVRLTNAPTGSGYWLKFTRRASKKQFPIRNCWQLL